MTRPVRLHGLETRLALTHLTAALARGLEPSQGVLTDAIRRFFKKRFETRGAYGGNSWPALAASTIKEKQRAGFPPLVMIRTGTLWASLTEEGAHGLTRSGRSSARQFGYSVLSSDKTQLKVGSWDPVLRLTERRRPVLPKEIPPQESASWTRLIVEQIGLDT